MNTNNKHTSNNTHKPIPCWFNRQDIAKQEEQCYTIGFGIVCDTQITTKQGDRYTQCNSNPFGFWMKDAEGRMRQCSYSDRDIQKG